MARPLRNQGKSHEDPGDQKTGQRQCHVRQLWGIDAHRLVFPTKPCKCGKRVKRPAGGTSTAIAMSSSKSKTAASFNKILDQPKAPRSKASGENDDGTKKLRRLILVEGIPARVVRGLPPVFSCRFARTDLIRLYIPLYHKDPTIRPRVWKILLRVNDLSADTFLSYVARGPCSVREKIRNDTFRYVLALILQVCSVFE